MIGSDLALVTQAHWQAAFKALETSDLVFGPSPDGGYYLVGCTKPHPELFRFEGWGGAGVLEASLEVAEKLGLKTALIESLPDLDRWEDFQLVADHPLAEKLSHRRSIKLVNRLLKTEGTNQR